MDDTSPWVGDVRPRRSGLLLTMGPPVRMPPPHAPATAAWGAAPATVVAPSATLRLLLGCSGRNGGRGWEGVVLRGRRGRRLPRHGWGRRRWSTTRGADGEGVVLHVLLHLLHPALLQPQVRHKLGEGGLRHQGEVGGGVTKVLVEAGDEHAEEKIIINLGADVTELIRQRLEAAAVVIDGLIVLMTVKKSLLQKNATLKLDVGEEAVELDLHNACVITIAHDRVKQVIRDGGEEPPDERSVDRGPLGVVRHGARVDGVVDVIHQIVLAEEEREIGLPRVVRGVGCVEDHGNAVMDVDIADVSGIRTSERVGGAGDG